jgi:type I restriction enzyme S subunit
MSKNKLIPKLRFPEFRSKSEWIEYHLYEISERILNGKVENQQLIPASLSAGIGFVSQKEKFGRDISGEQYKKYIVLKEGEFAYNKGNSKKYPQGCVYKLKEYKKVAVPNAFICFRFKNNFVADFYQGYFDNNFHGLQLQKFITSGVRSDGLLNINANDFFNIILPTPREKAEAQKIADCLSSLDELIAAQSQKLEVLKAYKKGLLQQLFPTEGERVPKLRFKGFENDGEWEWKTLGEISKLIKEKAGKKKYTLISINSGVGLVTQMEKFGREIAGDSYRNYIVIHKEDFAYNKSSTKYYPEGQIAMLENIEIGAVPNSIFTCFRIDKKMASPYFLKYLFENNIHGKWLRKFISIGARAHGSLNVDNKDLFSLPISFPNLKEQKKIADFLSSVDELITAQSQKLETLKLHKKGLMQGLFPKIENVD